MENGADYLGGLLEAKVKQPNSQHESETKPEKRGEESHGSERGGKKRTFVASNLVEESGIKGGTKIEWALEYQKGRAGA